MTLAALFTDRPWQWGLRGDPYLWTALESRFAAVELPATEAELIRLVEDGFRELTGQEIDAAQPIYVEAFAHGGMSSGNVSPAFWRDKALPMLVERFGRAGGGDGVTP